MAASSSLADLSKPIKWEDEGGQGFLPAVKFWDHKKGSPNNKPENFIERYTKWAKKIELGPGGGAGIGCGAGIGMGLAGGLGLGAGPWNSLRVVFGIGAGCGLGIGYGFGHGIGILWDRRQPKSVNEKRFVFEI